MRIKWQSNYSDKTCDYKESFCNVNWASLLQRQAVDTKIPSSHRVLVQCDRVQTWLPILQCRLSTTMNETSTFREKCRLTKGVTKIYPLYPLSFYHRVICNLATHINGFFFLLEISTKTPLCIITFPHQSGKDTSVSDPQVGLLGYLCVSSCMAF